MGEARRRQPNKQKRIEEAISRQEQIVVTRKKNTAINCLSPNANLHTAIASMLSK